MLPRLLIFVSTCEGNAARRRSLRNTWFRYARDDSSPVPQVRGGFHPALHPQWLAGSHEGRT